MSTTYDDPRIGHDFTILIDGGQLTLDCECGDVFVTHRPQVTASEVEAIQSLHITALSKQVNR